MNIERVQESLKALEAAMAEALESVHVHVNAIAVDAAETVERIAQARAELPELDQQVAAKQAMVDALEAQILDLSARIKTKKAEVAAL
jgi:chromosome segregation ATPase